MNSIRAVALSLAFAAGLWSCGCGRTASVVSSAPPVPEPPPTLETVRVVQLTVPEPSDMCLDRDGVHWWTVSDNTGLVYRLNRSDCAVVATLGYHGQDLEGIWQDPADGTLYVTEEQVRQIVHLDTTGVELGRVTVPGLGGDPNSGLEGITFDPRTRHFLVVQEKDPARLVEADSTGQVLALHPISYVGDLSGLTYVPSIDHLLIVSDQSAKVCWATTAGDLVTSWNTGVENGEGVAVDMGLRRIYVVSDSQGKFYEFKLP